MSENPLDSAYTREQLRLETETAAARREFDRLVNIIANSESPAEFGFVVTMVHDDLVLTRGDDLVTVKVMKEGVKVGVNKSEPTDFDNMLAGAVAAMTPIFTTAEAAADQIGIFMARIVEGRIL